MFADLHLHTHFSDGTWTPEGLAAAAKNTGLHCFALTDHDSVEGCPRAAGAAAAAGLDFIPGTELTAEQDGHEIHILGYLFDITDERLLREMARFQEVRQNRIREMVALLNKRNIPLEADAVFALANCSAPGRPHVARALVAGGFCLDLDEAFERFLKKNRPAWVPKFKMTAGRAIELIHQAGGVAVVAHPGLNHCDEAIPLMVEAGLDGIECLHTKHSTAIVAHYLEMTDEYDLLVTGGSDCHGTSKGKPLVGTVRLPYENVEKLKARAAQKRRAMNEPANNPPNQP
jgi:3',5'-nucleoside bisphosphate phosphatase